MEDSARKDPSLVRHEISEVPKHTDPDFIPPIVGKPSSLRYIWLVLIGFLVLSVVGGGAYLIDAENKRVPSQIGGLLTPTPVVAHPTVTITPTPDPMLGWTSYVTQTFALKYPPSWKLQSKNTNAKDKTEVDFAEFISSRVTTEKATGDYFPGEASITITVTTNSPEKELADLPAGEIKNIKLQGVEAKEILFQDGVAGTVATTMVVAGFDKKTYTISMSTQDENLQPLFESEFNQMLATFSFSAFQSASPSGKVQP
jgi:hypothetical protein